MVSWIIAGFGVVVLVGGVCCCVGAGPALLKFFSLGMSSFYVDWVAPKPVG